MAAVGRRFGEVREGMGMEQSRGVQPTGGPASISPEGVTMQILSTEHWSLLATRSLGYTDSFSRVNMFFSVLSGAVIALALIAQAGHFNETFLVAAILLLSIVIFVGVTTIARVGHLNSEDAHWVRGMNRIRHAYLELHPELGQYFVTGQHDDMRGMLTTLGLTNALPSSIGGIGHGLQTLPGMLTIIVAVVAGAWGALVAVAFGAPQALAIAAGGACFIFTAVSIGIFGRRSIMRLTKAAVPRFPTPD
jgi:hypothetical protein